MTAHWGIEDPAAVEGTPDSERSAFVTAFKYLRNRITVFTALPMRSISTMALQAKLREIGRMEGVVLGLQEGRLTWPSISLAGLTAEALGTALLVATVVGSGSWP